MTRHPKAKGELPFDHELIEPVKRADAVLYWTVIAAAAAATVISVAGFAGYVWVRWLT